MLRYITPLLFIPFCLLPSALFPGDFFSWTNQLTWEGWATIIIFVLSFVCLIRELLAPDMILFGAATLLLTLDIVSPEVFFLSFCEDIIITLAMLFVIARAIEVNGLLSVLASRTLPKSGNRMRELAAMLPPLSAMSAFMNNTPIVLMLAPAVRKWALAAKQAPSHYLIPISYATILGGVCTLMGTSVNLAVDGLLRKVAPELGFSFFEIGYVGLPCLVIGTLYLLFIGQKLVPTRRDPTEAAIRKKDDFISEFEVLEECPFIGKSIEELNKKYFFGVLLVRIEREHAIYNAPSPKMKLMAGDCLVFVGEVKDVASLQGIEGLRSLADPHFSIDIESSHFSEVVIANTSHLIGKTLRLVDFRRTYNASVLAVYRQGRRVRGKVSDVVLAAGDTLMLLGPENWYHDGDHYSEFYHIRLSEKVPLYTSRGVLTVLSSLLFIAASVSYGLSIFHATIVAAASLICLRCISLRQAAQSIQWSMLVLIGSAFIIGNALERTGVAQLLAEAIIPVISANPTTFIAGILLITMCFTEVITNNAASMLLFPIAYQAAILSGFSGPSAIKAVAVAVAIGASCSFITPIGYQTNTIVYGPGGYKFTDYARVGGPLSLLIWGTATYLIPKIWPLV